MGTSTISADVVTLRILFIVLPMIIGAIHCLWRKNIPGFSKIECFLAYFLIIGVGFQSLLIGHLEIYHSDVVVAYIGWQDTPFLSELGKSNTAWGILGILSFWFRGGWRSATALGYGLFLMMSSIGYYRYFTSDQYIQLATVGMLILTNIILALCLFVLLIVRRIS